MELAMNEHLDPLNHKVETLFYWKRFEIKQSNLSNRDRVGGRWLGAIEWVVVSWDQVGDR